MRIGLVCPYSLTVPGGVQAQILGLARALRGLGHAVRVLGPCDGAPPDPNVTPLGNSIPTAVNGSMAPLAPDPACALRTIRALYDERFDVVHVHEPLAPGPSVTAVFLKNAPLVGTFHAAGESAAYKWLRPATRWTAKRLDIRCAVSPDARAMAEAALGGDYELVFNGIDVDFFELAEPFKTDDPTIFYVGRHEPRKGLDVLLDAMALLPRDVRLWVGSDGPETARLKARYAGDPRIEWLGRLTDDEKARRYRGASVACFPSLRGESFGVVLLEAMAARTPIVASDLPGYRNVAQDHRDAVMVRPGDPAALAEALAGVLGDPALRTQLRTAGIARAAAFSMTSLARRYEELYERIA
ncbi:MAG: glycosyltransferase family 4 protein [Acidimicrobiia bacterium]